ncbi:MAG: hypothetical protein B7Y02_17160 [Rhodobacterales bacterium 17-64-5]|nr:MAG: hypothetical protein B7Y02_17160 [Rhodobacterales bacterium 17-64-5]
MKPSVLTSLCLVTGLAACGGSGDMRLYPLEGPIALNNPAQIITISLSHQTQTSGDISFRLPAPSPTRCTGTWTSVAPKVISHERGLTFSLRGPGGKVSNTTADVGGVNSGEIYAVCTDGTRVQGHFLMGSGTESGTGTVTDTLGNTYKLLF